ncbi:hypothetical protein TWF970_006923 [Orbilia oligospora]|uniref:Radical SAM core domain-containing protein n=1 Tax=Orbilia oligospora TaxID=2813651 RepID=A0A7C8VBJ9_ORBOL|nr:hypothetical protein TWF970_006923 [Orbilia oligospora]
MPTYFMILYLSTVLVIIFTATWYVFKRRGIDPRTDPDAPISVNYFPSRKCNYHCGFCFHTETSSYILPIDEAKRGLLLLQQAGMRKLNIAGGEPFLNPKFLSQILQYSKEVLDLESISIISNGSKIRENWLEDHAKWKYGIKFKLNTVVNIYNWDEDMATEIQNLAPFRWKVFQCLIVAGENDDETRKTDARKFLVTEEQWQTFCRRHEHLDCYVPEDNKHMASSYLLLDEYMCFLDKGEGMMTKSESILRVGVKEAMKQVVWDRKSFVERGGIYDWSRPELFMPDQSNGCNGAVGDIDPEELKW